MRKPSPLKHKEAANEPLHTTLTDKEHQELHNKSNVHESEDKNIIDQKEQDQKESRTKGTDINVLYDNYLDNPEVITKDELHEGDMFDDAEDRMVINLRNNKTVKNLNIKVEGPDDDDSLDRVGRHDHVRLTNEYGRTLLIRKDDPNYLDKINTFAKLTRGTRLRTAVDEAEKNGGTIDKTIPVIRNGRPVKWKDVTKEGNEQLYNSLTEGEKLRLADQETITGFETTLLNLKNNNNRLKDETTKNGITKEVYEAGRKKGEYNNYKYNFNTGLYEEVKDNGPVVTNIKAEKKEKEDQGDYVNTTANDGKSYKNRKSYIKDEKIKNESKVLREISYNEGREPGEYFQTKQEWLDYKQQQAIEGGPAGMLGYDPEALEKEWNELVAKEESKNTQLVNAKNKQAENEQVLDEILSAETNDDWRSMFFNFGENENLDFGMLDDQVREAILDIVNDQQYKAAQSKGIGGTSIGEGTLDFITGLNLKEKEDILRQARTIVFQNNADKILKEDAEYQREQEDYLEEVSKFNTEADLVTQGIEENTQALKEGGYIDRVNVLNQEREDLETDFRALQVKFNEIGDVDENSSKEEIEAYNLLVAEFNKLKVRDDALQNNELNKDPEYQALIKKGQDLERRREALIAKQPVIDAQKTQLDQFATAHNAFKETVFSELGYSVMDNSFENAFERTEEINNFKNHLVDNHGTLGKIMDVGLTFADGMLKMQAFNKMLKNPYVLSIVGGAAAGGNLREMVEGKEIYGLDDVIFDGLANFSKAEIFPTSEDESGNITTGKQTFTFNGKEIVASSPQEALEKAKKIDDTATLEDIQAKKGIGAFFDGAAWNINGYSAGKTIAEMLPYSLIIARELPKKLTVAARRKMVQGGANIKNKQGVKSLNAKTILGTINNKYLLSDKGRQAMSMVKATYRVQYVEEMAQAKSLGLTGVQQHAYANGMTLATGIAQSIMPDSNFFGRGAGKKLLQDFTENLSKTATRAGMKKATNTFFKNLALEIGEEEVELVMRDIVSSSMLASHSPEFFDMEVQRQTLMGTLLLSGSMGSVGVKNDYEATRDRVYAEFKEKGYNAIKDIDTDIEVTDKKIKELEKKNDKVSIETSENLKEAKKELEAARQDAIDIVTAINVSPKSVTNDQIENIVKKQKLMKEKEGKDPSAIKDINDQIKVLNNKIENSTVKQNQEYIYEKLLKNSMKISKGLGIKFNESRQKGYETAVTKEDARRKEYNEANGLNPKDKNYRKPVNKDAPGFITDIGDGQQMIFINKDNAKKNRNFAVAQHELLHGVLTETFKKNPKAITGLSKALRGHLTKDKMFSNYVDAKMRSYEGIQSIEKDEELLAVVSEAITQGHLKYDSGFMSKIGDGLRAVAREFGYNFKIKDGRDVYNFLRDYNKEVSRGRLSRGMNRIAIQGFKKGDIADTLLEEQDANVQEPAREEDDSVRQMESLPIYQRVDKIYTDNKADWKDEFKKKRLAQQMAYEFEGNVIDRLKDLKGFGKEEKQDIALDFITSQTRGLAGVIEGFDQDRLINKKTGEPYESVSAYLLHTLPSGKSLLDARLMEFYQNDPKYSNIIQSLSEEATQKKFEKEQKQGISGTRQEKEAIRFKIADRLGPKAKSVAKKVRSIISTTDANGNTVLKPEYRGKNIKELRGVVLSEVQELFGIKPKPGNLTAPDIKNAQFYIAKNAPALWLMLPEGYTEGGTSTGVTSVLMTERPTKKNKLKEIQDVFYTKSVVAKAKRDSKTGELIVEEKAKRPVNLEVQKKRTDISMADFKSVFGITERGEQNLYKKETNTSSRIRALVSETERMIVNQVAREIDPTQAMLADGISRSMYSNAFNNLDVQVQADIFRGLDAVDTKLNVIDITNEDEVNRVLDEAFAGVDKKIINKIKKDIGLGVRGAKLGAYRQYKKTLNAYEASGKTYDMSLIQKIAQNFRKAIVDAEKNLANTLGVKSWNGKPATKANLFQSNEESANLINTARQDITSQVAEMKAEVDAGTMTEFEFLKNIVLMNGMYAQASKMSDGRFSNDEPGGKVYYNKENKIGGQRGQVVNNAADWVALVNAASSDVILPTNEKGLIDKKALVAKYGFDPKLLKDKSVDVLSEIEIDSDGNMTLTTEAAREEQAMLARKLVKRQLQHWQNRINDDTDAFSEVDMLMQFYSMMSGMETPLRKGAMIYGIADGAMNIPKTKQGKDLEYDHAKPAHEVMNRIANIVANNPQSRWDKEIDKVFADYIVNIIPKKMDTAVKEQGRQSVVQEGYVDGDNTFTQIMARLFAADTRYHPEMVPITSISSKDKGRRWGESFVALRDNILTETPARIMQSRKINDAIKLNRQGRVNPRGMSTFDFDETLIDKGENFIIAKKGDEEVKISSGQWPIQGPKYAEQGYDFDFSDFTNVRGGIEGPLLQKMRNQIKKFGPKNVFVLTARPQESASAIHAWLESKNIKIPLKNITGLGNSTGEAKAVWMLEKFSEGYNDMYFVDDALPNVEAVKNVLDQLDIKSKVRQVRTMESAALNEDFNIILEQASGVGREKRFSQAKAELRGKRKGRFKFFIPASAEDFNGLLYAMLPKGKRGEKAYEFFKKNLLDPFARGVNELNAAKQRIGDDYKALRRAMPDVRKKLSKKITGQKDFRYADAVRVYLWDKAGYTVPGLSEADRKNLIDTVIKDERLQSFADALGLISARPEGYTEPQEYWLATNILGDLSDAVDKIGRKEFLADWIQNKNEIFTEENLNKLQAVYGPKYVEALRDILYRMENGTNRQERTSRLVNAFQNWVNNSVGAIMFFNARSALLQTLSSVNFINWGDNNILKAGKAFANQRQFWKDFATLFNSDMLKQRRKGLKTDVNYAELTESVGRSKNPAMAALNYLLQKGFLPTQIADSFAIASGGSTFYRNRINTYLKQGMTQKQAEETAFKDFQQIAEATQQSSRPDMISQQQASPLGRLILAFQNTPMQYMRLTKRAMQDLAAGRGDWKTHVSKILYYGAIQNLIFMSLQSALFALAFDDDEEDEEQKAKDKEKKQVRILNGMLDSILRGMGIGGAVVATVKNMLIKIGEEEQKDWNKDFDNVVIEGLQLSPPIGSKVRKLRSAGKSYDYNEEVIKRMNKFDIENPLYEVIGNIVSATTNIPLDRVVNKTKNIKQALNDQNEAWQRVALILGWQRWDLGMGKPEEVEIVRQEIKEEKKAARKEKARIKREEKKKQQEIENQKLIEENIKKQEEERKKLEEENKNKPKEEKKEVTCAAVNKHGKRCGNKVVPGKKFCTIHEKVEQRKDGAKSQCKAIKSNGKRCKMQTSSKSGYCYYHD